MRKLLALLTILALVAIPATARAQAEKKIDLTGKWLFNVTSEIGTGTPTVTIKQQGDSVTGHYSSATLGEVDFKGTFKDQKLVFKFTTDVGGTSLAVTYSGAPDGNDALKGSVDFGGMGTGTFTAKRQP